jgi:hypothetical protein
MRRLISTEEPARLYRGNLRTHNSWFVRLRSTSDAFRHFSIVWKTPERTLREDKVTIHDDLEYTVRTLDEARQGSELPVQFGRQPGGPWLVVSNDAVFDRDVHDPSVPSLRYLRFSFFWPPSPHGPAAKKGKGEQ